MTVELLQLLLLIIIANSAPILIRVLLNDRFNLAVDFDRKLPDHKPIFGSSKTWRGITAAIVATSVTALAMGYALETGLLVAVYAVLGDLTSSFIKRRLGMPSSSMAPLLDQVPESLFPALMVMEEFNLDLTAVLLLVVIFIVIEVVFSRYLYKWRLRKRPY